MFEKSLILKVKMEKKNKKSNIFGYKLLVIYYYKLVFFGFLI